MTKMQLKMRISGQVQNVWYRASTMGVARDLRLKGYAKNLPDDSVEVIAVGDSKVNLEKLKKWCECGPTGAVVEKIEEKWSDAEEQFKGFLVL
jgi:acylphosphatase